MKSKPEDVKKLQDEVTEIKESMDFMSKAFEKANQEDTDLVAKNKKAG